MVTMTKKEAKEIAFEAFLTIVKNEVKFPTSYDFIALQLDLSDDAMQEAYKIITKEMK